MIKAITYNLKASQGGFATMEMLIAMALMVILISTLVPLVSGNQSIPVGSQTNQEALYKAAALLEGARANASQDFNLVNPVAPTEDDIYEKSLTVQLIDLWTKSVTAVATWPGANGQNLAVNLSTLVTNPDAIAGGDTCSSVLEGDWTHPQSTEYEFGRDILHDTSSGFPITSIQSFNHKMYVTVNNDNGNNDSTFFILDISNPTLRPPLLGQLDNGSENEGLNAVAIDGGHYAYVANAFDLSPQNCLEGNNCAQLQIIDISDSSNPGVVKNFKIQSVTSSGKLAAGKSIFYKNGIVYIGLAKSTNTEFYIIDVGAFGGTPIAPVILGSFEIEADVNSIYIKNNYAYIASSNDQELKILNINIPSTPILVGGFDAPLDDGDNGNGKSINLVGNKLYFGRTLLDGDEFYILNNENSEISLPPLGSKNIQTGDDGHPPAPENTSINGIIVRDHLAFLITNGEFQIWKVDNPESITRYADPLILPPGSGGSLQGTATDCEGNYIYVGSESSDDKGYISIITSSPW